MNDVRNITAVIPAAGLAKRLRPITDTTPKCLIDIDGKNLLQRTIDNILTSGIEKFIIVTGYMKEKIEEFVSEKYPGLDVSFYDNPDYENNNNSYSLWLASGHVKGSMLLLDSDILFDPGIIKKLLNSEHENIIAVNFTDDLDDEQVKVILDGTGRVLRIGKDTEVTESAGESIGIALFSPYFLEALFDILNRKITVENNVNEFYEVSFQEVIEMNDKRRLIFAVDVSEFTCIEIDTPEDLESARNLATDNFTI